MHISCKPVQKVLYFKTWLAFVGPEQLKLKERCRFLLCTLYTWDISVQICSYYMQCRSSPSNVSYLSQNLAVTVFSASADSLINIFVSKRNFIGQEWHFGPFIVVFASSTSKGQHMFLISNFSGIHTCTTLIILTHLQYFEFRLDPGD